MKNIGILGSCITRDSFRTDNNENWHELYEIKLDLQRHSIITLMEDKVSVNEKLLDIQPNTPSNKFRVRTLKDDFRKDFKKRLIDNNLDYLILDMYFESIMGIIKYNNKTITNNFMDLPKTKFYKTLPSQKQVITMENNPELYFNLWTKSCDKLFEFINDNCPNLKIVLNEFKLTNKLLTKEKVIIVDNHFSMEAKKYNPIIEKLQSYIKKFDVDVIKSYPELCCDENHIWGKGITHFEKKYYEYFFNEFNKIVQK